MSRRERFLLAMHRVGIGLEEICALVGFPLFWYGLYVIYRPLAPLVLGALLVAIVVRRAELLSAPRKEE